MPNVHQSTVHECPLPLITSGAKYSKRERDQFAYKKENNKNKLPSVPTNELVLMLMRVSIMGCFYRNNELVIF